MLTVRETFANMPGRFKGERAQGVNATIEYDITGEGGGTYHVVIADGCCTLHEGPTPAPSLKLTMSAQDWLDMLAGKLSGQVAFMSGRLRHQGDMSLLLRLPAMFGI
jgi:putative sterol carrier protein